MLDSGIPLLPGVEGWIYLLKNSFAHCLHDEPGHDDKGDNEEVATEPPELLGADGRLIGL